MALSFARLAQVLTLVMFAGLLTAENAHAIFPADFDGDGKTDLVVYRPSEGHWYVFPSSGTCPSQMGSTGDGGCSISWGLSGDRPIIGDFDHDGRADFAVLRPSTFNWYIRYSWTNSNVVVQFGLPGDIESVGDIDHDTLSDLVVYRPSNRTYYVRLYNWHTGATSVLTYLNTAYLTSWPWLFGSPNTAHFYPYNLNENPGVYATHSQGGVHYSQWNWFDTLGGLAYGSAYFRTADQINVVGSFSGSSLADLTDWDTTYAVWSIFVNYGTYISNTPINVTWGVTGDIPVSGDYDGDGTNDVAVWRPSNGTWYIQPSSGTCPSYLPTVLGSCVKSWGVNGDIPVPDGRGHT